MNRHVLYRGDSLASCLARLHDSPDDHDFDSQQDGRDPVRAPDVEGIAAHGEELAHRKKLMPIAPAP